MALGFRQRLHARRDVWGAIVLGMVLDAHASLSELLQTLQDRAVGFDPACVERAMEEAAVRAVDPAGRLFGAGESNLAASVDALSGAVTNGHLMIRPGWQDWRVLTAGVVLVRTERLEAEDIACATACLSEAVRSATDGLVLDLRAARGNGWAAVPILAGALGQQEEELFWAEDARGERQVFSSPLASGKAMDMPLVVLTDGQTAGAAELLAGVLKMSGRAILVGDVTAGDPWWREAVPLADGRVLRVATRRLILADGESYESGIPPDVQGRRRPAAAPVAQRAAPAANAGADAWQEDVWMRQAVDILTALRVLNRPRELADKP